MSQALPFISTGMQAATSMYDGLSQGATLRGQAAADDQNANLDELQGAFNIDAIRRQGRAVQGEAFSAEAASGGDVSGTSARDLIFQNSLEIEYAAMNARYSAGMTAQGDRYKAQQERSAARSAVIGGVMRAGAAAISGASDAINQGRINSAYGDRYNAYFPGGMRLPVPSSYTGFSSTRTVR